MTPHETQALYVVSALRSNGILLDGTFANAAGMIFYWRGVFAV
jgi:hypothetical protein